MVRRAAFTAYLDEDQVEFLELSSIENGSSRSTELRRILRQVMHRYEEEADR